MTEADLLSQQKVWKHRAEHWSEWGFGEPLSPGVEDVAFQERHIQAGGATLVLGATPELCELARSLSSSTVAVDFSSEAIELFRKDGVEYVCQDWISYLEGESRHFDTIITDNGLLCLEFPAQWQRIVKGICARLTEEGVFSSRYFVSTEVTEHEQSDNPNLTRILPAMARAATREDWTIVKPGTSEQDPYSARYAMPPREVVLETLKPLRPIEVFTPSYPEGEHFISIAAQKA